MKRTTASSENATKALTLVTNLQSRFVEGLQTVPSAPSFEAIEWLRDEGKFGGGVRYATGESEVFNRGSVNISQVHYDGDDTKQLASATALSTIIHPQNPHAPSVHMHFSWTEMKNGSGYWRVMADLNPSLIPSDQREVFVAAMKEAAGEYFEEGVQQGERYFYIPALGRHRGVAHFYLEDFKTADAEADYAFVKQFAETMIDTYVKILTQVLAGEPSISEQDREEQLAYHTLYLFQVLTLDRGTTSGLLVHNQNDVGIMGSIPARVNRNLLDSWTEKVDEPQDALVKGLVSALPDEVTEVTEEVKQELASVVRSHYQQHPQALQMQARGNVIPPTVQNHK
eukprot:Seg17121.2 transcript_id=Seg17121.2/GoldUCD/mRNA.D3Y31 product="Oxygen-dependent coproporphyrinogen-III oxidase mitochondrial" protein_id=Seg17121.2/GoldUCD/D3Y31